MKGQTVVCRAALPLIKGFLLILLKSAEFKFFEVLNPDLPRCRFARIEDFSKLTKVD